MLFPVASPKVIENARQLKALDPIYLYTETTGFGPEDVVIEIGIVDAKGDLVFESLVNPNKAIPADSSAVNGITDDMVANAPQWKDTWPQVKKLLSNRIVGIYNSEFDLRLIKQTQMHCCGSWEFDPRRAFCAMRLYAAFYGDWNPRTNGFRIHKLEQAGKQCNIPLPNSHHAVDDARLTAALMDHIANYPVKQPNQ
jgi:DNA polymerase III epsilon subunit-like protein